MVINFWSEGDISTSRIMTRFLNDMSSDISCEARLMSELDWKALHSGINIFSRIGHPDYAWVPGFLAENSIPYIYYIDDNFWCIRGESELAQFYRSAEVVSTLDSFVRGASLVITHTPSLFGFIQRRFPLQRCKLLPAPFDSVFCANEVGFAGNVNAADFVVGYAGGYRQEEFELIGKAVERVLVQRPDIRFEFIGGMPPCLRGFDSVQFFPGFSDYQKFIEFKVSRNWSLGLAPLLENSFNASKTNNKFREYGGCGVPGLYSDVSPYKECVEHGVTGYLTKNDVQSWVEGIIYAADHSETSRTISASARQYVHEHYSHKVIAPAWLDVVRATPVVVEERAHSALLALRFDCMRRHYSCGEGAKALRVKNASNVRLLGSVLYEKSKHLYRALKIGRIFSAAFLVLGIFAFLNINIYLLLEFFS